MVSIMRVDERLLHGQVAVTWVNNLDITSILVANDEVAANEMSKMAIRMVKPNGINLAIKSVEDAVTLLNDPRTKDVKILVLARNLKDALSIIKETTTINRINIGGVRKKEGAKLISPAVYLNQEDLQILQELLTYNETVELQMTPSDSPKQAQAIIKQYLTKGE